MSNGLRRYAGKTYCPTCGGLHQMAVVTTDAHNYPKLVRCGSCGTTWGPWPSRAEFAERAKERNRAKAKRWRETHPDEHRRRVAEWCRRKRESERGGGDFDYEWATCPTCGAEFVKSTHNQVYCCVRCRNHRPGRREYMRRYCHDRWLAMRDGTWERRKA